MKKKITRRDTGNEEKEFILIQFTTLLSLVTKYLRDQELPIAWGLASRKKESEKELKLFLKKHGMIKRLKKRSWKI